MLDQCARGYTYTERDHNICIRYAGRTFPSLPTGEHGKRPGRAEIQVGHVKQMARQLGILDCAKRTLPILA